MKKIIDAIKIGESVGKKLSGHLTDEEERVISDWSKPEDAKEKLFKKLSDPDYIQEKTLYYKNFDTAKAWEHSKVKERPTTIIRPVRNRRFIWSAVAAVVVLGVFVTLYWPKESNTVEENLSAHQAIAQILPGRGVPVLYLEDNRTVALDGGVQSIEGVKGIEVGTKMITYSKGHVKRQEEYNRLVIPKGGEFHLVLADGSEVWLNSESTLRYFVNDMAAERVVYLQGEAYFKIAKDEKRPFKVVSGDHIVKVVGTEFNINAYLGSQFIYTTLVEGHVNVGVDNRPDILQTLQETGKQSVYNPNNKGFSIRKVDPRIYTAWKDGYFIFKYATLREVLQQLGRWYDFNYEVSNSCLDKYHFSGEFKRFDNLDRVLEIIRSTGIPFVLDYKEGKVIIKEEV